MLDADATRASAPAAHDRLDDAQWQAVRHRGVPLLVAAGPGSGKTRTLAARVASLLEDGVPPERVLLLTFTRRAASELLDRVDGLVPDRGARRVPGGTFHRTAVRLLRRHGGQVGLPAGFGVLDRGDAVDLMGLVRSDLGVDRDDARAPSASTMVDVLSRCVVAGEPLDEVLRDRFPWVAKHRAAIARCFDGFTAAKRRAGVLDLDDLLLHLRAALDDDVLGPVVRAEVDHVLVDEVQDVDPVQLDVLEGLVRDGASLSAVGDELQAIYGFRAGDGRGVSRFRERFPDARVLHLSTSYRCPPAVVGVANALAAEVAPDRPPLESHRDDDEALPTLTTCGDPADEARLVVDRVLEDREHGVPLSQMVILVRTGHHGDRLELELGRRDVPYRKFGGLRFTDTAHVRDLVALLRLLDAPHDRVAWSRTLRSLRGVGPAGAREAMSALGVGDPDARPGPLRRLLDPDRRLPGDPGDVAALRTAVGASVGDDPEPPPAVQVDAMLGLLCRTLPRRHRDAAVRVADLAELCATAAGYQRRRDLLADLALDPPTSLGEVTDAGLDEEWLTLSTIHSAKGGEWDVVHLVHAADGNLPSDLASRSDTELAEEARLAYVAVTRARRRLHVTYPTRFPTGRGPRDDRGAGAVVSRFLEPHRDRFATSSTQRPTDQVLGVEIATDGVLVDAVDRRLSALW